MHILEDKRKRAGEHPCQEFRKRTKDITFIRVPARIEKFFSCDCGSTLRNGVLKLSLGKVQGNQHGMLSFAGTSKHPCGGEGRKP